MMAIFSYFLFSNEPRGAQCNPTTSTMSHLALSGSVTRELIEKPAALGLTRRSARSLPTTVGSADRLRAGKKRKFYINVTLSNYLEESVYAVRIATNCLAGL